MYWLEKYKLILVSASPRRKELMEKSGFDFEINSIEIDESYPDDIKINEIASYIAKKKFDAAKELIADDKTIVITADTVVIKNDIVMGKPVDLKDAKNKLNELSNDWHKVITGVCIGNKNKVECFSVTSKVFVDQLDEEEIDYYINNCKVLDKAGAYGIQDWFGLTKIPRIEGSYPNIMGLPTKELYDKLKLFLLKLN